MKIINLDKKQNQLLSDGAFLSGSMENYLKLFGFKLNGKIKIINNLYYEEYDKITNHIHTTYCLRIEDNVKVIEGQAFTSTFK